MSAARSHSATVRSGPRVSSFLYLRPQSPSGLSAPPLSRCPAARLHLRSRLDPPAALPHPFLACAPRTPSDPRRFRIRGRVIPWAQRPYRDSRDPNAEITGPRLLDPAPYPAPYLAIPQPPSSTPAAASTPLCLAVPLRRREPAAATLLRHLLVPPELRSGFDVRPGVSPSPLHRPRPRHAGNRRGGGTSTTAAPPRIRSCTTPNPPLHSRLPMAADPCSTTRW